MMKVARIEIYAFIDNRWFMVQWGVADNAKLYKQERLYCRNAG
jgi:hypothetical protein